MEVLQRTANRGSISTGYDIDNSVKLEADNSEFFSKTPGSNSNRQTFTFSTWIKRTELGGINAILEAFQDGSNFFIIGIQDSDELIVYNIDSGTDYGYKYANLFRDTAAWYHIVFKSDTTNGTAANRWQVYINGVEITTKSADYGTPPEDYNSNLNSTISHNIGKREDQGTFMSCYLAETHLVDGTALEPTAFGEFDEDSGIWKPIEVSGVTYGTNGFYLDFSDSANLGDDASGNSNNFTENNITSVDQATDTPTNNFCTLNPLMISNRVTITNGATSIISAGVDGNSTTTTMGVSNGKWYWEFYMTSNGGTAYWPAVGYTPNPSQIPDESAGGSGTSSKVALLPNGGTFVNGSIISNKFNTFSANDIAGFALDMDNGNMYIYKNGTIQNSGDAIFTSIGDFAMPIIDTSADAPAGGYFNFGGYAVNSISSAASDANGYGTFEYAPPSGYYALCTKNLAEYG